METEVRKKQVATVSISSTFLLQRKKNLHNLGLFRQPQLATSTSLFSTFKPITSLKYLRIPSSIYKILDHHIHSEWNKIPSVRLVQFMN